MNLNASNQSSPKASAVVCRVDGEDCDALDLAMSRSWLRIGIAAVFAGQGMVFSLALNMTPPPFGSTPYWVLHGGLIFSAVIVICFLGGPLFRSTIGMLAARRLSIEGLFTLSLLGAFVGSLVSSLTGEGSVYYEVVSIVIAIYTAGRMLSERSQSQLRLETERLREDFAHAMVLDGKGKTSIQSVSAIAVGARVRVAPGAAISVDGVVKEGVGYVQETALTGEPTPVVRRPGDRVRAGTWSVDGAFDLEVTSASGGRELDTILRTVEDGNGAPSELQLQANRLTQFFLPIVAAVSLCTAFAWLALGTWTDAVLNSMAVLLVACPCALGLATPVAIWNGLFRLSRLGLVSRDGALIDTLARTRQVFFDKTGTLSESSMQVTECLVLKDWQKQRGALLASVAAVEGRLSHPIARSICQYLADESDPGIEVSDLQIVPGAGVLARTSILKSADWWTVQVGETPVATDPAMVERAVESLRDSGGKRVYVFIDDCLAAIFVLQERLREGVDSVWDQLGDLAVQASVLTGDPNPSVAVPHGVLMHTGLSAAAKAEIVAKSSADGARPLFVGDGINDTSAMTAAAGSIAMGSGTRLTQTAASGYLVRDELEVIPQAIELSREIYRRLRGNLSYAAVYNLLGMAFASVGWLHPILAALIMLISSFWVTARALGGAKVSPKL